MSLCVQSSVGHGFAVGIMGTPRSSGNRGVEALGESLLRLCNESSPLADVILFGGGRTSEPVQMRPMGHPVQIRQVCWTLSPKGRWRDNLLWIVLISLLYRGLPFASIRNRLAAICPWVQAVRQTQIIGDIRGGDSFSDIYGVKRFLMASIPVWSVILIKGSIVLFPQTYGPFKNRCARAVAGYILRKARLVVARDIYSLKVAESLIGREGSVILTPDVAFALYSSVDVVACFEPVLTDKATKIVVGLNVNGLLFNGGYTKNNQFGLKLDYVSFVNYLVLRLLEQDQVELLLIPHTFAPRGDVESDNAACDDLWAKLPSHLRHRVHVLVGEYNSHQVKAVIGGCDFFVGSRMHACIAALSQGVPCAGVAYSMKFLGVFESVGMGEYIIDARQLQNIEAVSRVLELFLRRSNIRAGLASSADLARVRLKSVFDEILRNSIA